MKCTTADLAKQINAELIGNGSKEIRCLRALSEAEPDALCPLFYKGALKKAPCCPGAVFGDEKRAEEALQQGVDAVLIHPYPKTALAALIDIFYPPTVEVGSLHPTAVIHSSAAIHPTVSIGPHVTIEADVSIGENSVICASAVICRGTVIGKRVIIGPNAVIGYEGFGVVPAPSGMIKIRQIGAVLIEDEVEIGANTCIDRGTLGTTRIGRGAKIDNLVQIGHNAEVGKYAVLCGQVGIAGSVTIGDRAMLGGQAGAADHLNIGADAKVAAKSGVVSNVKEGSTVAGYPAVPRMRWLRFFAAGAGPKPCIEAEEDKSPVPDCIDRKVSPK